MEKVHFSVNDEFFREFENLGWKPGNCMETGEIRVGDFWCLLDLDCQMGILSFSPFNSWIPFITGAL